MEFAKKKTLQKVLNVALFSEKGILLFSILSNGSECIRKSPLLILFSALEWPRGIPILQRVVSANDLGSPTPPSTHSPLFCTPSIFPLSKKGRRGLREKETRSATLSDKTEKNASLLQAHVNVFSSLQFPPCLFGQSKTCLDIITYGMRTLKVPKIFSSTYFSYSQTFSCYTLYHQKKQIGEKDMAREGGSVGGCTLPPPFSPRAKQSVASFGLFGCKRRRGGTAEKVSPLTPLSHKRGGGRGVNSPPLSSFPLSTKAWMGGGEASAAEQLKPCLLEKRGKEMWSGANRKYVSTD